MIIQDETFTEIEFFKDPFKWIDAEQFMMLQIGGKDKYIIDRNPIDGIPDLFNGIDMNDADYVLMFVPKSGPPKVIGRASCHHLLMSPAGFLSIHVLPIHQAILASVISMSTRDVTAFSPMIQINAITSAIPNATDKSYLDDLLVKLITQLSREFEASLDKYRKASVFYYMIFAANFLPISTRLALFEPCFSTMGSNFVYWALNSISDFEMEHDVIRENLHRMIYLAAMIFPQGYSYNGMKLYFTRSNQSVVLSEITVPKKRKGGKRICSDAHMIGVKKRVKAKKNTSKLGVYVKRKRRKERWNVMTDKVEQTSLFDFR